MGRSCYEERRQKVEHSGHYLDTDGGEKAEEDKERDGEMNYKPTGKKPTGTERQETVNYGEAMLRLSSSCGLTTVEYYCMPRRGTF